MRLTELADQLVAVCKESNLEYDPSILPVKLTADCYIFYATHLSASCVSVGNCKVDQFYALTGGDTIKICESAALWVN